MRSPDAVGSPACPEVGGLHYVGLALPKAVGEFGQVQGRSALDVVFPRSELGIVIFPW